MLLSSWAINFWAAWLLGLSRSSFLLGQSSLDIWCRCPRRRGQAHHILRIPICVRACCLVHIFRSAWSQPLPPAGLPAFAVSTDACLSVQNPVGGDRLSWCVPVLCIVRTSPFCLGSPSSHVLLRHSTCIRWSRRPCCCGIGLLGVPVSSSSGRQFC